MPDATIVLTGDLGGTGFPLSVHKVESKVSMWKWWLAEASIQLTSRLLEGSCRSQSTSKPLVSVTTPTITCFPPPVKRPIPGLQSAGIGTSTLFVWPFWKLSSQVPVATPSTVTNVAADGACICPLNWSLGATNG